MFIDECEGMSCDERLRMVGLTTLETRRLRADMIEVYNILRDFEETDEVKNRVCDDWNRLPGWVISGDSGNEFNRNLDHYLRDNRGFK